MTSSSASVVAAAEHIPGPLRPVSPYRLVAVGASVLGLDALANFLGALPATTRLCVVVMLDIPKVWDRASVLRLLRDASPMTIGFVERAQAFEAGRVLIVPTDLLASLTSHAITTRPASSSLTRGVATDLLFRELADVFGEQAVGVLLAGEGSDGAAGLACVRHAGGVTFAQAPFETGIDDMPRHAILAGSVDIVLPAAELAECVLLITTRASVSLAAPATNRRHRAELGAPRAPASAYPVPGLREVLSSIKQHTGRDFTHYRTASLLQRLQRRARLHGAADLSAYRRILDAQPDEPNALARDILSSGTGFFHDSVAYAAFESTVMRNLANVLRESPDGMLRAWCVECATGAEAFSLAMALSDAVGLIGTDRLRVFASDGDGSAIVAARAGTFPPSIAADVGRARLRRFMDDHADGYRIKKHVRERVVFAVHDLFRDPPFSNVHVIVCRSLLPHLTTAARETVLRTFHRALLPQGYLWLDAEGGGDAATPMFKPVEGVPGLYRACADVRSQRMPAVSLAAGFSHTSTAQASDAVGGAGKVLYAEVHRRAIEQFSPPSVIVTREHEVVHVSAGAERYLQSAGPGSEPRLLSGRVNPALRRELIAATGRACATGQATQSRRVVIEGTAPGVDVRVTVRPFRDERDKQDLLLITFHEVQQASAVSPVDRMVQVDRGDDIATLEAEIALLQQRVSDAAHGAARSSDCLHAANQALETANDELRVFTADLLAGRDLLHAINEELITVNVALREASEETSDIHDDLQNLIRSSDLSAVRVDQSLAIQWYTPRARDVMALRTADRGRPLAHIAHRLRYPELIADVARTVASASRVEREVQGDDGSWFLTRVVPYRTYDRQVDGAVIIFVDISERRRVEERIRAAQARMRLVAETTQEYAFIAMNDAGIITSWNVGAERLFGFVSADMVGKPYASIFTQDEREQGIPVRELAQARLAGHASDDRWRYRKDGTRFYCSGVLYPLMGEGVAGFAKISRDRTQHHREQAAREQALQRTLASNELKDVFFAMMSHELRHPLNLIQLNMELLGRGPDVMGAPTAGRAVDAVKRAVRDQARIIDELLDIARISTGKLKITRTSIDFAALVARCVAAARVDANAKGVMISTAGSDAPCVLSADRTRVEQAVGNLLANAIKFTPRGGHVFVTLSDDGAEARLDIADTGIGIAADRADSIFTLLSQLDPNHATRSTTGLGVGLALSRHYIEAHGGGLNMQSDGVGKGATFTVRLRLSEDPAALEAAAMSPLQRLQGVRIVLADDSREALDALGLLLEDEGAKVVCATSGFAVLDLLRGEDFDILITDLRMPGMDGIELIRRIRKVARNAGIPAIALTGLSAHGSTEPTSLEGFETWLCKPVSVDRVVAAVLEHLP